MIYTLTAERGGFVDSVSQDCNDTVQATIWAVAEILERSYDETNGSDPRALWALGKIELTDENGVIIHTMDEKVQDDAP